MKLIWQAPRGSFIRSEGRRMPTNWTGASTKKKKKKKKKQ